MADVVWTGGSWQCIQLIKRPARDGLTVAATRQQRNSNATATQKQRKSKHRVGCFPRATSFTAQCHRGRRNDGRQGKSNKADVWGPDTLWLAMGARKKSEEKRIEVKSTSKKVPMTQMALPGRSSRNRLAGRVSSSPAALLPCSFSKVGTCELQFASASCRTWGKKKIRERKGDHSQRSATSCMLAVMLSLVLLPLTEHDPAGWRFGRAHSSGVRPPKDTVQPLCVTAIYAKHCCSLQMRSSRYYSQCPVAMYLAESPSTVSGLHDLHDNTTDSSHLCESQ